MGPILKEVPHPVDAIDLVGVQSTGDLQRGKRTCQLSGIWAASVVVLRTPPLGHESLGQSNTFLVFLHLFDKADSLLDERVNVRGPTESFKIEVDTVSPLEIAPLPISIA